MAAEQNSLRLAFFQAVSVKSIAPLPLAATADASIISFAGFADGLDHCALRLGAPGVNPLVRLHSECVTGDVFGSLRCDCGPQMQDAIGRIAAAGGYLLYLRQEGRGIGLGPKVESYALQSEGLDTYEANRALGLPEDARDYGIAAAMLRALGVPRLRLLSGNPDKAAQLRAHGIEITEIVPTPLFATAANGAYLRAKRANGHSFSCMPG